MTWHILKKDLKQLWPFALATAAVQFAIVAVHLKLGVFEEQPFFSSLLLLLETMMYFGVAVLIATLVHQDSIVGIRQDWLVRPIRRHHLLASKLLFLLLSVQLPMLVAALFAGIANGFPLTQSLLAAVSQNLYFLVGFALPIFAFVSITRNTSEALAAAFVIAIAITIGTEALVLTLSGSALGPTSNTGLSWIPLTWRFAIYFVAAAAILVLQYFRRATQASRLVLAAAVVLCLFTEVVPWHVVYAWQRAVAPAPASLNLIAVGFDPALGPFQSEGPRSAAAARPASFAPVRRRENEEDTVLYIPLQFTGIPAGSTIKIDRAVASVTLPGEARQQVISTKGDPGDFEVSNDGQPSSDPRPVYETLHVRGNVYTRLKDTPVTLHLDYSETLLNLVSTRAIAAVNGDLRIPGLGHCQTRLNDSRTAVEFRCLDIGNPSQCTTVFLQDPSSGLRNPPVQGCLSDYSPYFGRYKPPDPIMHSGANLIFRDPGDLVHYPVNGSMVDRARVLIRNYAVAGHFTEQVTIPAVRLADWSAP